MSNTKTSDPRAGERGFTLAAVIVMMTVILVFIAYTVPRQWSMVMQRERDRQTIFAMKQYARAILEWQKRHGGLPTSLDQLKDARKPRFVRGPKAELVDPQTGEVDWILVPPAQGAVGAPVAGGGNTTNTPSSGGLQIAGGNFTDPVDTKSNGTTTNANGTATTAGTPSPNKGSKDYVGPFIGVRPNKTGKAFIALNNAENYEDWSYTLNDLTNELNAQAAALAAK